MGKPKRKGNRWAFRQIYLKLRRKGIEHDRAVAMTLRELAQHKALDNLGPTNYAGH